MPAPLRILLLETMSDEPHRHHGAELFPFLLPLLRQRQCETAWWTVLVPRALTHQGGRFTVDLPPQPRAQLAEAVRAFQPDVIACHNRLAPPLEQALRLAAPHTRFVDFAEPFEGGATRRTVHATLLQVLGSDDSPPDALLYDQEALIFERTLLDPEGLRAARQPLRLVEESACLYRRALAKNPLYAHLPSALTREHVGCSFCEKAAGYLSAVQIGHALHTPAIELALRQIAAYQQSPLASRTTEEILIESGAIAADLKNFLAAVLQRGLQPATFYCMPRIDEFVGQAARIEALLPELQRAGHRIRLLSTGLENFSPQENERFNKGVSAEQVWACFELIQRLEQAFPDTFFAETGFFAGILFTPWTRPEDLRINLEAAQRLGSLWLSRVVGVRLQLRPNTPIAELAQHDGLMLPQQEHTDVSSEALTRPGESELAWRFADPRVETLQRLLVRLDPLPHQSVMAADDALLATVRAWRRQLPAQLAADHVGVSLLIVEAGAALGVEAGPDDVLREAARRAPPGEPAVAKQAEGLRLPTSMLRAMAGLQRLPLASLGGYQLVARAAAEVNGAVCLRLAFAKDGRSLRMAIAPRRPGQSSWLEGTRFGLTHDMATPPSDPADLRLGRFVLAWFERANG